MSDKDDLIRERAHQIWQERGQPEGPRRIIGTQPSRSWRKPKRQKRRRKNPARSLRRRSDRPAEMAAGVELNHIMAVPVRQLEPGGVADQP
jgi:hypothetical protein